MQIYFWKILNIPQLMYNIRGFAANLWGLQRDWEVICIYHLGPRRGPLQTWVRGTPRGREGGGTLSRACQGRAVINTQYFWLSTTRWLIFTFMDLLSRRSFAAVEPWVIQKKRDIYNQSPVLSRSSFWRRMWWRSTCVSSPRRGKPHACRPYLQSSCRKSYYCPSRPLNSL